MALLKLLSILIAYFATATSSQEVPSISYISMDQTKNIGTTTNLDCAVENARDLPVLWLKFNNNVPENRIIISYGNSLVIQDSHFSLTTDTATSTYSLQIHDTQETDEGTYQCQVRINSDKKITAEVKLHIFRPPIISVNSTNTVVVGVGQSVKLECYANGYPPPQIFWRRENNLMLPSGSLISWSNILEINSVKKEDRGIYFCVAENGVGKKVRHKVELNIEFPPIVTSPRPRIGQALQYPVDMDCNVESYPDAAIYWHRNGTVIQSDLKYTLASFSTSDSFSETILRILKVEPSDYGTYICKAVNKLGVTSAEVELFETNDPVCPPACNVRPVTNVLETTTVQN